MAEEIQIEIDAQGNATVGAKGVSGSDCEALTKAIEDALGEVATRTRTAEYHQPRRAGSKLRPVGR